MKTTTTITVNEKAYDLLMQYKGPGITFSDIILNHMHRPPARTAGDLLDQLKEIEGQPIIDEDLMPKVAAGHGRGTNRRKRHVS